MMRIYPHSPFAEMVTKKTAPAKKPYRLWADYIRRVHQYVEARSPKQAFACARKRPLGWRSCDWHEHNGYRISNEVQDLQTEEFLPVNGVKNCKTCGSEIVDTVNDGIQTFVRPAAGAILFAGSTNVVSDIHPILALVAGLLVAGGVHATKTAARPVVTVTTAGIGNPVVSTLEDVVAFVVSLLAILLPIIAALLLVIFLVFVIVLVRRWRRRKMVL